jgi:hypothetical protein
LTHGGTALAEIHSGLQVRYRLDDGSGTTATDSFTKTGRDGTLTNGAQFISSGRVGGAVDLLGTDEYIDIPAVTETDGASSLTVAFWLNTDTRADDEIVLSKYVGLTNHFSIQLGTTGTGDEDDLVVLVATSPALGFVYTTGSVLIDGNWIHVAVVFNGSETGNTNRCKIYINGIAAAVGNGGIVPATLLNSGSDHWLIGCRDDSPSDKALDGKVDEFHLYNRALSPSDIQELYFQSDGSILFNGAAANPNSKLENTGANVLDGSDETTICAWLYSTGQGETVGSVGGVAYALDEVGNNIYLYHPTSGENLTFLAKYATTHNESTFAVPHNVWTPVAISHKYASGNTPTIRVNFQSVSPTQVGPSGNPIAMNSGYCIGNITSQAHTWAGRIAHVQIFNRLLSAAEMDACLKEPGSITHNLRLWLPMTSASDTGDRSGNGFHGSGTALETANVPPYDPRYQFGVTDEISGQILIRPNGTEPALGVRGVGTRSKLTCDSSIDEGARMITTEAWGIALSQVIEPTVRDLYLYGNAAVPDTPYGNALGLATVANAIAIDGDAAEVTGCKVYDFRGDGIRVNNSTAEFSRMIRMPRVRDNKVSHCWNGIHLDAVDSQCSGNRVANVRDVGILDSAGATQLQNNHSYGATTAIQFGIEPDKGGPSTSVGDRFADAHYGFVINHVASRSAIMEGTCFGCWVRAAVADV